MKQQSQGTEKKVFLPLPWGSNNLWANFSTWYTSTEMFLCSRVLFHRRVQQKKSGEAKRKRGKKFFDNLCESLTRDEKKQQKKSQKSRAKHEKLKHSKFKSTLSLCRSRRQELSMNFSHFLCLPLSWSISPEDRQHEMWSLLSRLVQLLRKQLPSALSSC